jgi:hypothetical protein
VLETVVDVVDVGTVTATVTVGDGAVTVVVMTVEVAVVDGTTVVVGVITGVIATFDLLVPVMPQIINARTSIHPTTIIKVLNLLGLLGF